jgi:uncharacterized caspase-like protein
MLCRLGLLLGVIAASLFAAPAQAERRVALVIGNSAYVNANVLRNPKNDAADFAETLKKVGFEVDLGLDLDQRGLAQTIEKFARNLEGADVGLLYYAGHALQINEKNYLVSTSARLENEFLVASETMELEPIIRLMESKAPMNLIFLDACRNNPLADNLRRNMAALKRSGNLGRGLARIEGLGRDTLIAFAAAPGQEAADGAERNSPFTGALLRHVPQPGLEVSVMLKEVAADVRRETRNSQRPQQLSDMSRTFYFAAADAAAAAKIAVAPPPAVAKPAESSNANDRALDVAYWNSAQAANDCESVRTYLQRFPDGAFVDLARLAERRLCAPARRVTVEPDAGPSLTPSVVATAPAAPPPPPAAPPPPPAAPAVAPVETPAQPAAPAAQPNIAALPEVARLSDPSENALSRDAHLELVRLGCFEGNVDGSWGKASRDAVAKFNRYAHSKISPDQPSGELVSALREHEERVCPLTCGRGYKASGDSCVAVEREHVPSRKERKAQEREERRERAQERAKADRAKAERAKATARATPEAPAPATPRLKPTPKPSTAKSDFVSPLCESRIQVGQKWCCTYDPPRGPSIIMCK